MVLCSSHGQWRFAMLTKSSNLQPKHITNKTYPNYRWCWNNLHCSAWIPTSLVKIYTEVLKFIAAVLQFSKALREKFQCIFTHTRMHMHAHTHILLECYLLYSTCISIPSACTPSLSLVFWNPLYSKFLLIITPHTLNWEINPTNYYPKITFYVLSTSYLKFLSL